MIIDNNSWKNTQRVYSIVSVFRPGTDFVSNSEKLIKWLNQESGYFRLEDDYDPHVYRMAAFKGNGSLPNLYDQATVLAVTFDCKPQRWLKSGEKEINFTNSKAILDNPTGYNALPDVKISNISNPASDDVLLVTVGSTLDKENFSKVTSIITLSEIPADVTSITLVSEDQTCYSNQNGNINKSINLNNTQFPVLEKDISMITIKKYQQEETLIESYNKKLEDSQYVCQCKYLPYDSQVKTKEKITITESWNLLKQKVQEVYDAKSYATYCMEKADTYTFESYNNLLMSRGVRYTIRPSSDEVDPSTHQIKEAPWLVLINNGNNTYTVKVGDIGSLVDVQANSGLSDTSGFFYINSGNIIPLSEGDVITASLKESSSLQIDFYPAKTNGDEIAVDYETPDWCAMNVMYDDQGDGHIESISFVAKKTGYFYLPKSGIFGSAGWSKLTTNAVLTTLKWSSFSKAFMPSGISVSKTATFTYYFLPYPYKTPATPGSPTPEEKWLQYEPIMKYKTDKDGNPELDGNGNKIEEVEHDVNFYVDNVSDDLSSLKLKAKVSGWFRNNELQLDQFITKADGHSPLDVDNEITMPANFSAKSSFIIYTIRADNFPSYDVDENWPEYIDPIPKKVDGSSDIYINPADGEIDFKVNERAWYRVKYTVTVGDDTDERNSEWVLINQNGLLFASLNLQDFTMASNQNITIEYLEALETNEFPISQYVYHGKDADNNDVDVPDVAFFDKDGNLYTNNKEPSWLNVVVVRGEKEDNSDATLQFNVGEYSATDSLFKWDSRSIWMSKNKIENGHLTDASRTDDTTVYYLLSLPEYTVNELGNKYSCVVNQNSATGDPETVSFYPIANGYYKPKNSSNWKWFVTTDEICLSKNSEKTTIYNLKESETQDNFDLTIIPRWWSL